MECVFEIHNLTKFLIKSISQPGKSADFPLNKFSLPIISGIVNVSLVHHHLSISLKKGGLHETETIITLKINQIST